MPTPNPYLRIQGFSLEQPPAGFVEDPYPFYAALREHDPVHELAPGSLLLTRYDDVLAIYRDARASSDKKREFGLKFGGAYGASPLFEHHTTSLVFNDPPLHTRVRRLLIGALNPRAIARMEVGITVLVDGLLDRLAGMPEPDLIEDFAARIPVEVVGNLLDIPHAQRAPLRDWSLAILSALEPAPSASVLARGNAAVTAFLAQLRALVAQRRQHPGDPESDVLTRLLQGSEVDGGGAVGPLTESELLHNCIFLLNAGHETTTNLIGNGVHALLSQHEQFDRLVAEPALLGTAVEELLRFESPLQLNNRITTMPLQIGTREVPAGCFITLGIGAANRDPAEFHAPDRLDIARKPNRHLAFGQGAHACAGLNVARLEARVAIGRLIERYPRLALRGPPQRDFRVRFRGFKHLPVSCR